MYIFLGWKKVRNFLCIYTFKNIMYCEDLLLNLCFLNMGVFKYVILYVVVIFIFRNLCWWFCFSILYAFEHFLNCTKQCFILYFLKKNTLIKVQIRNSVRQIRYMSSRYVYWNGKHILCDLAWRKLISNSTLLLIA